MCAVSYTTQFGEKLYFRKFFKFQVNDYFIYSFSVFYLCYPSECQPSESSRPRSERQECRRSITERPKPISMRLILNLSSRSAYDGSTRDRPSIPILFFQREFRVYLGLIQTGAIPLCEPDCRFHIFSMEGEGCERTTAFSLHSIFHQVLKPLDVKTKFYNAEVRPRGPECLTRRSYIPSCLVNGNII